jgi:hypothetical protein
MHPDDLANSLASVYSMGLLGLVGKVVSVRGAVVDLGFDCDALPPTNSACASALYYVTSTSSIARLYTPIRPASIRSAS